ncbi:MAG: hypothetical protein KDA38_12310 [Planctomycetales bacterium]|nr:hypothetical protein [Planctomycetales bacterium]
MSLKWGMAFGILAVTAVGAFLTYREHLLNAQDIVAREHWPRELVELIRESAIQGDSLEDVEVRDVGWITTYAWKMPATQDRLDLHVEHFKLVPAPANGIEHKRILSNWPHAWDLPSADFDMYANPIGLPGAEEGEFVFVLLHDKGTGTIYFYYYFHF